MFRLAVSSHTQAARGQIVSFPLRSKNSRCRKLTRLPEQDNLHYTDTRFEEMRQIPVFAASLQDPELLFRRQQRQARQAPSTVPPPNLPPPLFYAPPMPHVYTYR